MGWGAPKSPEGLLRAPPGYRSNRRHRPKLAEHGLGTRVARTGQGPERHQLRDIATSTFPQWQRLDRHLVLPGRSQLLDGAERDLRRRGRLVQVRRPVAAAAPPTRPDPAACSGADEGAPPAARRPPTAPGRRPPRPPPHEHTPATLTATPAPTDTPSRDADRHGDTGRRRKPSSTLFRARPSSTPAAAQVAARLRRRGAAGRRTSRSPSRTAPSARWLRFGARSALCCVACMLAAVIVVRRYVTPARYRPVRIRSRRARLAPRARFSAPASVSAAASAALSASRSAIASLPL